MSEWSHTTLGEVATLQRGFDLPVQDRTPGVFPIVASNGRVGTHKTAKVTGPGVVIGRSGSVGGGQYITEDFWPLNTTLWVKDFHGNNERFCYYLLLTIDFSGFNSGSGVPTLNRNHVHPLPISLPPRNEQDEIAKILGSLDDKIENNLRMNETLEAMAQAIFKDWFFDFGPVRRKASGMTDPAAILGGLITDPEKATQTAALFPDTFGDNGLPEGWIVETLRDVLELSYGKSLPKTKRVPGPFPVYGSGGVTGSHEEPMVKGPGIIIGRKGTVGSLYWEERDFFPIDTVFFVTSKNQIGLNYLWQLLNTLGLHNMNTDAAVPGLNRDNAYRLIISNPRQPLKDAFEGVAATLQKKLQANVSENSALAETRDYLLPRLMCGQIRAGVDVIVDTVA